MEEAEFATLAKRHALTDERARNEALKRKYDEIFFRDQIQEVIPASEEALEEKENLEMNKKLSLKSGPLNGSVRELEPRPEDKKVKGAKKGKKKSRSKSAAKGGAKSTDKGRVQTAKPPSAAPKKSQLSKPAPKPAAKQPPKMR